MNKLTVTLLFCTIALSLCLPVTAQTKNEKATGNASKSTALAQKNAVERIDGSEKSKENEKDLEKQAKVTRKQAEAIALKRIPGGKIKKSEIENEDGQVIWSFDIEIKKSIKEVHIDALSGKVTKVETESREAEAREKPAERKTSNKSAKQRKRPIGAGVIRNPRVMIARGCQVQNLKTSEMLRQEATTVEPS